MIMHFTVGGGKPPRGKERERERAAAPTATAAEEKECWGERVRERERRLL